MSVISGLQDYMKTFTSLETNAPVWVNYLRKEPVDYSVVPLGGSQILLTYLNGSSKRELPFAIQSNRYTDKDTKRVDNIELFETLSDWFDTQNAAGTLPTLPANATALRIEALGHGFLFEKGGGNTGIYQLQGRLVYSQRLS